MILPNLYRRRYPCGTDHKARAFAWTRVVTTVVTATLLVVSAVFIFLSRGMPITERRERFWHASSAMGLAQEWSRRGGAMRNTANQGDMSSAVVSREHFTVPGYEVANVRGGFQRWLSYDRRSMERRLQEVHQGAQPFPSVEESTILFMHVFKCAGSTLRRLLVSWAEEEGSSGLIANKCEFVEAPGELCLYHYHLLDTKAQEEQIAHQKVIAGHFLWGFQEHVKKPYLMITTLRNPLELFVSAQQYIHRRKTKTLESASEFVSGVIRNVLQTGGPGAVRGDWKDAKTLESSGASSNPKPPQITGFIRRFVGMDRKTLRSDMLEEATNQAIENLEKFWLVGVVEQYDGFLQVMGRMLDPAYKHGRLWHEFSMRQYNRSPIHAGDVLSRIDASLVHSFNQTLSLQWDLYSKAVELWDVRCRLVLPEEMQDLLCTVRVPPSEYISHR